MTAKPPDRLAKRQLLKNVQVRDAWDRFAPHRRQVTQLLMPGSTAPGQRCCLFGAGNCNDLDLDKLSLAFEQLHLVDIDGAAMREGVSRQEHANDPNIVLHAGVDLSGLSPIIDGDRLDADLDAAVRQAAEVQNPGLTDTFEVAASICLLTQLLEVAAEYLGSSHDRYLEFVQAIRLGHLRLLIQRVTPGGMGVLITDLVSSDSDPELQHVSAEQLADRVRSLIEQRNFFTGVNPAVLHALLTTDPELSAAISEVEMISPWCWDLGPRVYAVYAIRFRKR